MNKRLLKFIIKFNYIYIFKKLLKYYYKKDIRIDFNTYISIMEYAISNKHRLIADELYDFYNLTSSYYNDKLYFYIIKNDKINLLKYFENMIHYKHNDSFIYYMLIYDSFNVLKYFMNNHIINIRDIEMYLYDRYIIIDKSNFKPKCFLFLIDKYDLNISRINNINLREYLYKLKNENRKNKIEKLFK